MAELECRKDGYYLALVKDSFHTGNKERVIAVLSKNGKLYSSDGFEIWSKNVITVFEYCYLSEMYISNYSQNYQSP